MKHMKSKANRRSVILCFLTGMALHGKALASGIGIGAIAGVSGAGALATGGVALPVAGAAQVVGILACFFLDPPDTENACTPVDISDLQIYSFPDAITLDPGIDPTLGAAADAFTDDLDVAIALGRAHRASLDRHEGALIIGDPTCAADRLSEANSFRAQTAAAMEQASQSFKSFIDLQDEIDPTVLDGVVTKQDVKDMRDLIAAGNYPAFEDTAIQAYNVTQEELDAGSQAMGGLADSDIDALFSIIDPSAGNSGRVGDVLSTSFALISFQHNIPTISEWGLVVMALLCLTGGSIVLRQRRKAF